MTRFTIELINGAHFEVEASSNREARRDATRGKYGVNGQDIIEVRPFAAKPKAPPVPKMPGITVKADPFEVLERLKK
jgi:hypothetical protein